MSKIYSIDFDKLYEGLAALPIYVEKNISDKELRYIEIIKHLEKARFVKDIDWGSFTEDELHEVFDYIENKESEVYRYRTLIQNICRDFKKKKDFIMDIF